MPSLNFQKQFVPLIESGQKRQTIRPVRKGKVQFKPYCKLFFFTGLRTKQCRELKVNGLNSVWNPKTNKNHYLCKSVKIIRLYSNPYVTEVFDNDMKREDMIAYRQDEHEKFAKADGFDNHIDFFNFFKKQYGLPFEGVLIKW